MKVKSVAPTSFIRKISTCNDRVITVVDGHVSRNAHETRYVKLCRGGGLLQFDAFLQLLPVQQERVLSLLKAEFGLDEIRIVEDAVDTTASIKIVIYNPVAEGILHNIAHEVRAILGQGDFAHILKESEPKDIDRLELIWSSPENCDLLNDNAHVLGDNNVILVELAAHDLKACYPVAGGEDWHQEGVFRTRPTSMVCPRRSKTPGREKRRVLSHIVWDQYGNWERSESLFLGMQACSYSPTPSMHHTSHLWFCYLCGAPCGSLYNDVKEHVNQKRHRALSDLLRKFPVPLVGTRLIDLKLDEHCTEMWIKYRAQVKRNRSNHLERRSV